MDKSVTKDKESDIKLLNSLVKEAGAKARDLKNEAMKNHYQKLHNIISKSK